MADTILSCGGSSSPQLSREIFESRCSRSRQMRRLWCLWLCGQALGNVPGIQQTEQTSVNHLPTTVTYTTISCLLLWHDLMYCVLRICSEFTGFTQQSHSNQYILIILIIPIISIIIIINYIWCSNFIPKTVRKKIPSIAWTQNRHFSSHRSKSHQRWTS